MDDRQSVLIVDASDETRDVLQTALERRGVRTMAASRAGQGLEMARRHRPDLIVLDLEIETSGPDEVAAPFAAESRSNQTSLVLLGSMRREPTPQGEYIAKPYHYGPLIRRIEEMLSSNREKPGLAGQTSNAR